MANTTNFSSLADFSNYVSGAVAAGTKATNDYTSGAVAAGTKATIEGVNTYTNKAVNQAKADLEAYMTGQNASVINNSNRNTERILKNQYLGKEPWIWAVFALLFAAAFAVVYIVVAKPIAHIPMKVFLGVLAGLIACLVAFISPIANRQPQP
ncbi:MAG: hypothetical protein K5837_03635 [Candidatus Saccharibacteria bacterium]|nr:hypothetical protein [Candidatus Saccharibacteria bacterium]